MNLRDAFDGMREAQAAPEKPAQPVATRIKPEQTVTIRANAGKTAKSADPDFEAVKIYIRRDTHKMARRKWEDAADGDFSELVQKLLEQYLGT